MRRQCDLEHKIKHKLGRQVIDSYLIYTASITPDITDKSVTTVRGLEDILVDSSKAELMTVAINSQGNEATLIVD
jgi:hypothetical protein